MWWCRFQGSWTLLGNDSNKNLELWNSEEDSTFVIVTLWLTIMFRARWKQKEIKSTNHHSVSHLTMIHRWRWTVQHWRHCRHFHLSAAVRMIVIHFLFDPTEPSIKVIESVDELKLWNHKLSANKRERRNSFQPEGLTHFLDALEFERFL